MNTPAYQNMDVVQHPSFQLPHPHDMELPKGKFKMHVTGEVIGHTKGDEHTHSTIRVHDFHIPNNRRARQSKEAPAMKDVMDAIERHMNVGQPEVNDND